MSLQRVCQSLDKVICVLCFEVLVVLEEEVSCETKMLIYGFKVILREGTSHRLLVLERRVDSSCLSVEPWTCLRESLLKDMELDERGTPTPEVYHASSGTGLPGPVTSSVTSPMSSMSPMYGYWASPGYQGLSLTILSLSL